MTTLRDLLQEEIADKLCDLLEDRNDSYSRILKIAKNTAEIIIQECVNIAEKETGLSIINNFLDKEFEND